MNDSFINSTQSELRLFVIWQPFIYLFKNKVIQGGEYENQKLEGCDTFAI